MPIDYQKIVIAGKEFPLEVTLLSGALPSEEEIKWEMKVLGSSASSEEIGAGMRITYTLGEEYIDKIVVFTAYREGSQFAWQYGYVRQEISCYVQPKPQQILIRDVEPKSCNVLVWDKVEFRVTAYSIDTRKVTDSTRQSIKWQIRVDGKEELFLSEDGYPVMSDRITVEMKQEWAGKEILVMPYLNEPTDKVSAKVSVAPLGVNNSKRMAFYIHGTTSTPERWKKWPEGVETLNQVALPDAVDTGFDWGKEATQFNVLKDRWPVAKRLCAYVKEKARGFGEIVLVGHSHGGNVAIMAADMLAKEVSISTIYVITVGTPVFNKSTFTTTTSIPGLIKAKDTKVTIKSNGMAAPYNRTSTIYTHTYYNPENPVNWQSKDKIKHLSIYNRYDRVDGIAKSGDGILESSRMTSETSCFAYNKDVNVEILSRINANEKKRFEYRNHCSHRISMLRKLRSIISNAEMPMKMVPTQTSTSRDQDNTRVAIHTIAYELSGYRKISTLPGFKILTYQEYLNNPPAAIKLKNIDAMRLEEMHILFEGVGFKTFVAVFNRESKSPLLEEYPYAVDVNNPDFRSPNLKKIDSEIDRLTKEIEGIEAFNARTMADRTAPNAKNWGGAAGKAWAGPIGGILFREGIKYLTDGVDNHSFDANSPELIQQAIDEGRIKPFEREDKKTNN